MSGTKVSHNDSFFYKKNDAFIWISGLGIDLVRVLPGIMIQPNMKLLDAWVVSLGVRYC